MKWWNYGNKKINNRESKKKNVQNNNQTRDQLLVIPATLTCERWLMKILWDWRRLDLLFSVINLISAIHAQNWCLIISFIFISVLLIWFPVMQFLFSLSAFKRTEYFDFRVYKFLKVFIHPVWVFFFPSFLFIVLVFTQRNSLIKMFHR